MRLEIRSSCLRASLGVVAFHALISCTADRSERICALLGPEECAKNPSCSVLSAERLDEERACGSGNEAIACTNLEQSCDDALTLARDTDGQLFLLPSTCLPVNWKEDSDAGSTAELSEWPLCE